MAGNGGADAVERLRSLHLDGAALDEFPLLNQQAFSSIVRPALADYHGWAVVAGTPMGDAKAFYQLKLVAEKTRKTGRFSISRFPLRLRTPSPATKSRLCVET